MTCHIVAICFGFNWTSASSGEQATPSFGDLRGNLLERCLEHTCGLCRASWLGRLKLVIHGQSVRMGKARLFYTVLLHQMPLLVLKESLAELHLVLLRGLTYSTMAGNVVLLMSARLSTHTLGTL